MDNPRDYRILRVLRATYLFWDKLDFAENSSLEKPTGNAVIDFMNMVLGTSGIFEMRKNIDVHPLAQLSSLGKGMMDAAVRNAALAVGGAIGSNILKLFDEFSSDSAKAVSGFFSSMVVATIGIAAVLFYVLPMLPFIYFLFAASGWIKSIFEAIVAIPLWALAHIRIDGEGLPGPGATNGYFLLLEIFIRPILIFTGFIASITIFSASVSVLNIIFDLVVANVGGFDYQEEALIAGGAGTLPSAVSMLDYSRSAIDEFFYTGMYAIICYMMAVACFKLIDQIPNKILRWAGVSVSTFQENAGDPASQLTNQVYKGSLLIGNQIKRTGDSNLAILTS
jgi:conjugal transfer/type IV secretion protein DotA/TraY